MWDFLQHHELAAVFIMVGLVIAIVIHYERWRDRRALSTPLGYIWQCVQFGGGASVDTPVPMDRVQAIEFCSKLGNVAYVDELHHKIFYKSRPGS